MIKEWIRKNRQRINQDLKDINDRKYFSPALYILTNKILKELKNYAKGNLIDIGCGDMPFKNHLPDTVSRYDTLDMEARTEGVTYISNAMDMKIILGDVYDTAICFEVLEHVPNPFMAVGEINRILKKNGILLISVPHMWPIHEAPHDYLRFTAFGIKYILEENNFEIISIAPSGGILTYFGHTLSTVILGLVWPIPILKQITFFCTKWLIVLPWAYIDDRLIKSEIAPLEYLCIARKK